MSEKIERDPTYPEVSLRAALEGVAYMPGGRPVFARRYDETDAEFLARIMATLDAKRPLTPKEIVESVIRPGGYTMNEDVQNLTVEITCPDLSVDEERELAGRFPIHWRVAINGRSAREILP